jgi:hypothetical protein
MELNYRFRKTKIRKNSSGLGLCHVSFQVGTDLKRDAGASTSSQFRAAFEQAMREVRRRNLLGQTLTPARLPPFRRACPNDSFRRVCPNEPGFVYFVMLNAERRIFGRQVKNLNNTLL